MFPNWHDLIFSDQTRLRYRRHEIFWFIWLFYFMGSYVYEQQGFQDAGSLKWILIVLVKSILLLLCHAFFVYNLLYYLLPKFAFNKKYFLFLSGLLSGIIITFAWAYFCYDLLFPLLDKWMHLSSGISKSDLVWNSAAGGLVSALKVLAAATAVKLLKRWYLQQRKNDYLEKEKLQVELQLLKAQIHPDFLFSSLDNIYVYTKTDSPMASELLLKLSDLLSYMLYECQRPKVELEKELKMIRDYIMLEKTRLGSRLEVDISIKGEIRGKMITPLFLLPLIENGFSCCSNKSLERTWINLDFRMEQDEFSMKMINGKSTETEASDMSIQMGLANLQKRLDIYYPQKSEIRILMEDEMMMTTLTINLQEDTSCAA